MKAKQTPTRAKAGLRHLCRDDPAGRVMRFSKAAGPVATVTITVNAGNIEEKPWQQICGRIYSGSAGLTGLER